MCFTKIYRGKQCIYYRVSIIVLQSKSNIKELITFIIFAVTMVTWHWLMPPTRHCFRAQCICEIQLDDNSSRSASFSIFEQMGSIGKKESLVRTKGTRNEEEIRNNRISIFFFLFLLQRIMSVFK